MVLNNSFWPRLTVKRMGLGLVFLASLFLMSCGSTEEAMVEEEGFEDEPLAEQQPVEDQQPAEEESDDQQALTSFIGATPKQEVKKEEPPPPKEEAAPQPTERLSEVEELRMENTSLKQQIVKLEQDVRNLSARLSDAEAKYMAEKARADRAEDAARVAAQSAAISARTEPTSEGSMSAYETALQTFNSKAYDDAISRFQAILDSGVGNELADNCHYWIGESNYGKKSYQEAVKHFEVVFQYAKSEKLADAHFMLAQCYERLGDKQKAKMEYETVVNDFPMSGNVGRARERSARL